MMKRICLMMMGIMILSGTGFGTETNGVVENNFGNEEVGFETVEGVPLTFNEMSEIEGAGYRNAIATSFWNSLYGGTITGGVNILSFEVITYFAFGKPFFQNSSITTYLTIIPIYYLTQGFFGWNKGMKENDRDNPLYRDMGFAWLDHEMFDWIPEEASALSNESGTNQEPERE